MANLRASSSKPGILDLIRSSKGDLIIIPGHGHMKSGQYMDLRLPEHVRKSIAAQFKEECEYSPVGDYWVYGLLTSKKSHLALLQVGMRGFDQPNPSLKELGLVFLEWWKQANPDKTRIVFIEE